MKVQELVKLIGKTEHGSLRALSDRYAAGVWRDGWKPGKQKALDDPKDPFQGGPRVLLERGITKVRKPDGSEIEITPRTRLRMRDLDDESLERIGILHLKPSSQPGADVVHQEFVETWQENVATDPKHLLNNLVATAAVVDAFFNFFATSEEVGDAARLLREQVLQGAQSAEVFAFAARMSWIGRAVQDGSWAESGDFEHYLLLTKTSAGLDPYVVVPVLTQIAGDLESGYLVSLISGTADVQAQS